MIPARESEVAQTGQRDTTVMIRNASKGKAVKNLVDLTAKMGKAAQVVTSLEVSSRNTQAGLGGLFQCLRLYQAALAMNGKPGKNNNCPGLAFSTWRAAFSYSLTDLGGLR